MNERRQGPSSRPSTLGTTTELMDLANAHVVRARGAVSRGLAAVTPLDPDHGGTSPTVDVLLK
jgi:hypothetical protein